MISWSFDLPAIFRAAVCEQSVDRLRSGEEPAQPTPVEDAARRQQREHIVDALGALPREQRGALELAYFEGLSHAEIALQLGTPIGTIKTWVRRGMAKMAKALRPHHADLRR